MLLEIWQIFSLETENNLHQILEIKLNLMFELVQKINVSQLITDHEHINKGSIFALISVVISLIFISLIIIVNSYLSNTYCINSTRIIIIIIID